MTGSPRGYREEPRGDHERGGGAQPDQSLAPLLNRWQRQSQMITTALWLRAFADGRVSLSAAATALPSAITDSPDARAIPNHVETLIDDSTQDRTLGLRDKDPWLTVIASVALAEAGHQSRVRLLLPRPGDPRGLTADALHDACIAGAIVEVVRHDRTWHLAAVREHEGLMAWRVYRQTGVTADRLPRVDHPSTAEADRQLRGTILQAEGLLSDLGHRGLGDASRRLLERALGGLFDTSLPPGPNAVDTAALARALRIAWTCDIALADDSPAVSLADAKERQRILAELDRAARRAVEASLSPGNHD